MDTLPLFEEPSDFDRAGLRSKLAALASQKILIGTSSWKYEGWIGQIYSRNRYLVRGRFSEKRFQAECLSEYAQTFPIVCGDFSFYQFPAESYWQRLFSSAPASLQYAFKAPEEITVKLFPTHPRYGARAGEANSSFLDAPLFQNAFLDLLEPYRDRIAVLIFEFGSFPRQTYRSVAEFLEELDPFLASLPPQFRYAVEIRNQEFLSREYFECLRRRGVAHVFNAWTRMPSISEQMALPDIFTADFTVARALLRKARPYEQAVAMFTPYKQVQDPNPETRQALRALISRARERHEPSYIFVNNRLEGNAPQTIEAVVD
ncbi:MAG TPA: DUF72 domain-containing protein [Bryobacteraceae bacterium]|nr:DUF72 domain-containing protein [Bryobacteraceae bacterium]